MCLACGSQWPSFSHKIQVAPAPVKEETIYIDDNAQFYPDYRQGIHPPGPVYQGPGAASTSMWTAGMYGTGAYPMNNMYAGTGAYGFGNNTCNYQVPGFGAQQFTYPQTGWPYTYAHPFPYPSLYNASSYSAFNTPFASEPPHLLHYPAYACENTYSPLSLTAANNVIPGQYAMSTSPTDLTAQAAAAAEHNKQIASMPNAPAYMVGTNQVDVAAQNAMLTPGFGMTAAVQPTMGALVPGSGPTTIAPYKPGEANQFWCRETDGAWSLRNYSEICLGEVSPGHWEKHAITGYFFWVRHLA